MGALAAGLLLAQPAMGRRAWRNADSNAAPGERAHRGLRGFVFIAGYLDLTEDQKTQLRTIVKDARTEAQALAPQLKDLREAIREAVKNNAGDNAIQILATRQGDLHSQLASIRIKAMVKFYKILTPEQKAKADELPGQLEGLFGGGGGRGRFGS
jgi:Spy/CpxP family protein refolding chaperone